jgi:signal transduction protein with GAF and PtsI domain
MDGRSQTQDPYAIINELNTRIRILEGKYNLTRERMLVINQNMLDHYKTTHVDIKTIEEDMIEIKDALNSLKNAIKNMLKEMQLLARKEEVKVLEKYINMWNPLKLMTEDEVKELIEKRLKNVRSKK